MQLFDALYRKCLSILKNCTTLNENVSYEAHISTRSGQSQHTSYDFIFSVRDVVSEGSLGSLGSTNF